ncbi:MAG: glycosyltransferase [Clostridia bacterium]|nr:glycosyltransferase [Clostridia bacterium]
MSGPMFSIIIPVYNTEKELERCVRSVTGQTFRDLELILVDDGSRDNSGALCDAFAAEDPRVKVIHQQNSGCSEARNSGVRAAQGEYFIFVDSDDMWDDDNALEGLSRVIDRQPGVDVVCFGVKIIDENGAYVKERKPELPDGIEHTKTGMLRHLIYTNGYFSTSYVKALRKEFFLKEGLFFIKGLLSEDIEWSARILLGCKSLDVYPHAFYKRIQRSEGSITSSIGKKNITDILGSIERGTALVEERAENDELKELYFEYWAYQYAMLLGLVYKVRGDSEYPALIERLKSLSWLLKYDHVDKVRAVRRLVRLIGVRGAVPALSLYYRVK